MSLEEKSFDQEKINFKIWLRIISLLSKHKKELYWLFFFMVIVAICDTVFPYINKIVFDEFVGKQFAIQQLYWLIVIDIIFIIIQTFSIYQFFYWAGKVELNFSKEVRMQGFKKIQELPFSYFDKTANGWIIARLGNDIARLAEIISWGLMDLVWGVAVMIFISGVMLVINWKLALLVLVVVPPMALLSVWFQQKIHRKFQETRRQNSLITASYSEGITGVKTSKTLVLEEQNCEDFRVLTSTMRRKSIQAALYSALFLPLIVGLASFSTASLLWYGGSLVILGVIQIGTLMLFSQYATQFFEPLRQIAHLIADMQMAQTSAERVLNLLDQEVDIIDTPAVVTKYGDLWNPKLENYEEIIGDVEFRNVLFSYLPNEIILSDFSLSVKAGEMIALVGETGGGKSTIVNLLCRFYEPIAGEILIDGIDYRQRSVGWLHANLGYVLQTPHLFDDTILENVRYGNKDITFEQVEDCCKMVNADQFIIKLEKGYLTKVGESGNKLSSGQKQLISFARALCAQPKILILDEATSSVDSKNEQAIQQAMDKLLINRTSFVVAHRLSTITKADKILVIKDGKIVEQGKFQQLLKNKGYFYQLHKHQQYSEKEEALLNSNFVIE